MSPTSSGTPDELVGHLVAARYRLQERVGYGGMAAVYRADDESLGRTVAIKLFHASLANGEDAQRQREEISLLAGLNHPGLVTLFDAVSEGDTAFLVMEYVAGSDLRQRLNAGVLDSRDAAALGAEIADALAYIHERGVVHRDVKPANILLTEEDRSGAVHGKLADFGIARLIDSTHLTAAGSLIGTAGYLSPEQALGKPVGPPSDVYSLGLVLLESVTGTRAFPGTAIESASARINRDPDVPDSIGAAWSELLRSSTSRDPGNRPPAHEFAERLRAIAADDSTLVMPVANSADEATLVLGLANAADAATVVMAPATPVDEPTLLLASSPAPATARRPRVNRGVLFAAAVVVAALVVGAGVWITSGIAQQSSAGVSSASPASSNGPAVAYPVVDGDLGAHLAQLQKSVDTVAALQPGVLAVTEATAASDPQTALTRLDEVDAALLDEYASQRISESRFDSIQAASELVRADLDSAVADLKPGNGKPGKPDKTDKPGKSG